MKLLSDWLKNGYLRVIDPVGDWLVEHRVSPNTLTTIGTCWSVVAGVLFATGHIRIGGWVLGVTALFDVMDGIVARRTNRCTVFGAFYDSTLDRISDGALLGGLVIFWATSPQYASVPMLVITLLALMGAFQISYTRARAEGLGVDAKVGMLQRPERVVLLSAPQAFFGLALGGWILKLIILFVSLTAWITVVQRMIAVREQTTRLDNSAASTGERDIAIDVAKDPPITRPRPGRPVARPLLKGE